MSVVLSTHEARALRITLTGGKLNATDARYAAKAKQKLAKA